MQQPRIQYVKSADDVQIAYTTFGRGPPVVFAANAWGDIEMAMGSRLAGGLESWTAAGLSVVVYDGRNVGSSDRGVEDVSLSARVGDLEAVADALQLDSFAIMGAVHGSTIAVDYAVRHPGRVTKLALVSPYANGRHYYTSTPMLRAITALSDVAEENWQFFTLTLANWLLNFTSDDQARRIADIYTRTMDPRDYRRLIAACEDTDITDSLPRIQAPTLVVRSTGLQFSLLPEHTRQVTGAIPGAQLVTVHEIEEVMPIVIDFLRGDEAMQTTATTESNAFRAVLFTDLVGHTEMMSRLGDVKGREVLREHERVTRETLATNGGTEVKAMGDGFMASFGSVTKAVECAVALQRSFAAREGEPLSVRVGLNAGEPIEEDGDLFGATVIVASRIAARAEGGEILVANAVRELCSGKGFLFGDRGEFVPKGFEEPVRTYEVKWRE